MKCLCMRPVLLSSSRTFTCLTVWRCLKIRWWCPLLFLPMLSSCIWKCRRCDCVVCWRHLVVMWVYCDLLLIFFSELSMLVCVSEECCLCQELCYAIGCWWAEPRANHDGDERTARVALQAARPLNGTQLQNQLQLCSCWSFTQRLATDAHQWWWNTSVLCICTH